MLTLAVLGVAVHVLVPQVDELRRTLHSLGDATWWYLLPAVGCAALTFPGAAWSLAGATTRRLPFGTTVEAQLAAACLGRIAPGNLGSLGVTGAFLHGQGATAGETTAALGLDAVAGVVVHVALLAAAAALVGPELRGRGPHPDLDLPNHLPVLVAVAVGLAVVGVAVGAWWYHRRHSSGWSSLGRRFVQALREGRAEFAGALRSPRQGALLLGGSSLITLAQIACLGTCVMAFDGRVGVVTLAFVYLAGAALSAVAPTPGGLGAMEAALVSGLTLFGVASGPAVTGVLVYRLLTFWAPIVPGAIAVRRLRRHGLL